MTVLAIAPRVNSPGKKDATGAFHPEAREWVRLHSPGRVFRFDNDKADGVRFAQTMAHLGEHSGLQAVGFFCHGFRSGIQCGASVRNVQTFAWALRATLAPGAPVALYACDAGRDLDRDHADDLDPDDAGGAGGFASLLSEALGPEHWVDAHVTTAHTTINPHVRRFVGGGDGEWLIAPADRATWAAWRHRLKADRAFRLSFSLMPADQVRAAIAG